MSYREEIIGGARLILGDCREVLPTLGGVDAVVITDPPYGISHSSNRTFHQRGKDVKGSASWAGTQIANDHDTSLRDCVLAPWLNVASFGTWKTPPVLGTKTCLVWDKGPAFGMGDLSMPWKPSFELIYIKGTVWSGTRDPGVIRGEVQVSWENHPNVDKNDSRVHPHQKPVGIVASLINKAPAGSTILDPFMGSGTTGVACARLGRKFIGIEIEPKYFDIALRRITEAQRQGDLLRDIPPAEDPADARMADMFAGDAA